MPPSRALLGRGADTDNAKLRFIEKNTYLAPEDTGAGGRKDIVSPAFAQAEALGHVESVVPGAGWADWAASRCVSGEGPPSKVSGC